MLTGWTRRCAPLLLVAAVCAAPVAPAHAQGRVSVANEQGTAAIDPRYATTLQVSGSGFQSVRGGHGGIYVFFGTVNAGWRPSKGGATGRDYFYVPDSEARANAGYQRYVAFPGSDTASSANGGVISADGRWSTSITVPGAVFEAVDRGGSTRRIDCRAVTCGIITVGAHGVANATNETFTPLRVTDLYDVAPTPSDGPASAAPTAAAEEDGSPTEGDPAEPAARTRKQAITVDRAAAVAGRVMAFSATGLPPGAQISAVLDDGIAAAGPFVAGADGRLTGVITLPVGVAGGTHELRLFGLDEDEAPRVRFPIGQADSVAGAEAAGTNAEPAEAEQSAADRAGAWFFAGSALVLLGALARLLWLRLRRGTARA